MAEFRSHLSSTRITEKIIKVNMPLIYFSDVLGCEIIAESGFYCDGESVPRIPVVYAWLGHTTLRGGVLHDLGYRYDCPLKLSRAKVDAMYREICIISSVEDLAAEGKKLTHLRLMNIKAQAYAKWAAVRVRGGKHFHKKSIHWKPDCISEA